MPVRNFPPLGRGLRVVFAHLVPGPKAWYEVGEYHAETPAQWREGADRHDGSWWEDWARWTDTRAGRLIQPPPMGGDRHPALGAAPGDYVRG